MHRIIPIVGIPGHLALQALAGGSSAVSAEADAIHQAAGEVVQAAEQSIALFGEKAAALSELDAMALECSEGGWDGDDATAIDPIAVLLTKRLIRALPDGIPVPEFAPEPDGWVSVDWIRSRHRMLSLSIGRSSRIAYAWLDGADRGHGVAGFDGQNVPPRILEAIGDIMGRAYAAVWAA
jgi:hypothetical protein